MKWITSGFFQSSGVCRFALHWDATLIAMYRAVQLCAAKPLLSTYPAAIAELRNDTAAQTQRRSQAAVKALLSAGTDADSAAAAAQRVSNGGGGGSTGGRRGGGRDAGSKSSRVPSGGKARSSSKAAAQVTLNPMSESAPVASTHGSGAAALKDINALATKDGQAHVHAPLFNFRGGSDS